MSEEEKRQMEDNEHEKENEKDQRLAAAAGDGNGDADNGDVDHKVQEMSLSEKKEEEEGGEISKKEAAVVATTTTKSLSSSEATTPPTITAAAPSPPPAAAAATTTTSPPISVSSPTSPVPKAVQELRNSGAAAAASSSPSSSPTARKSGTGSPSFKRLEDDDDRWFKLSLVRASGMPSKKPFSAGELPKILLQLLIDGVSWETFVPPSPTIDADGTGMTWQGEGASFIFRVENEKVKNATINILIQRRFYMKMHVAGEATATLNELTSTGGGEGTQRTIKLTKKKGDKAENRGQIVVDVKSIDGMALR